MRRGGGDIRFGRKSDKEESITKTDTGRAGGWVFHHEGKGGEHHSAISVRKYRPKLPYLPPRVPRKGGRGNEVEFVREGIR